MSVLADRLLAVDAALTEAAIPHAFGGAIALAYCVKDPRGTNDIDVNAFVGPERADEVLDALPREITVRPADRAYVKREGQVRLWWQNTPVDLFLDTDEFHRYVATATRSVPFDGATIDVLGCTALIVFKALFGRGRDWGDIATIIDDGVSDGREALDHLSSLLGPSDPTVSRLAELVR